jgi:hypothetical protein
LADVCARRVGGKASIAQTCGEMAAAE